MHLAMDLHSHSGYAGGVGSMSFEDIERNMPCKGISVVGTGDCLHPLWRKTLENTLRDCGTGLYEYHEGSPLSYLLQTEIIFTADIGARRKGVHVVLFFPSFEAIDAVTDLFSRWGVKNTVGRPFVTCADPQEVGERIAAMYAADDGIEVVPAHVMTPEGVFGSKAPVDTLSGFFGEAAERMPIIETGLSADPLVLSLVPELDGRTFISNSDAHSAALHRMGREFTSVTCPRSYDAILSALRHNRVDATGEFHPSEGRYFLTGHRASRAGHDGRSCVYGPGRAPSDRRCPICGKQLTIGVLERALDLSRIQGDERAMEDMRAVTPFYHMVPLVEVIARARGIASCSSAKVLSAYHAITSVVPECALWGLSAGRIASRLADVADENVVRAIIDVREGRFSFEPPGYDGEYGELSIGDARDCRDICICH